ncbi:hypothetical protein HMPREF1624_06959 [Sporothrix schenckii ATCC 58251]|uniref:Uncharacterized protein n=1 Tax=Sporothrix schenckii (strain ATCC 58251 / de Perez 2211183) TaxID=1391915 RepID=U7PQH9_SPOS1|nr:hypothetical protein HMPREF1624_06959 [Sporothrix schenckii ATCC 58251]
MFSPLLSPPADEAMDMEDPLGERLSQRNVYDTAPPPGYKRLNKVRSSRRHTWANARSDMEQPHSSVDGLQSRVFRPRHLLPPGPQEPLFQQLPVQFLGDGFSGDEAKARPHGNRKRVKSDSSNSVGSSSKRKKKADVSPILGSLDIVSLSQEESAIDMAAAAGAAFAAAKAASRINTVMEIIPLRPVHAPPAITWDFNDTQSPVIKTEVDDANMDDDVVAIPSLNTARNDKNQQMRFQFMGCSAPTEIKTEKKPS